MKKNIKHKLVIIGANDFQAQLIKKASSLGYETHVFAWEQGAVGKTDADYFYPISVVDKKTILAECKKIKPVGVCSIGSELTNITANYVAQNLGLVSNSPRAVLLSTNKHEMRKAFEKNGNPSPQSILADSFFDVNKIDFNFPVIVKPTDRSGSRGITKIVNKKDLEQAIKYACSVSWEKKALIEEFAKGKEYSVEYISYKGKHSFLALTEKFTTGAPYYVEFAHKQPALLSADMLKKLQHIISKALDSLCIEYGASHSEIKIDNDGNIKIIEIGSRMGGDCIGSDLVPLSTGYDYMKMVIDISCGKAPDFSKINHYNNAVVRFICTDKDVINIESIKKQHKQFFIRDAVLNRAIKPCVRDSNDRLGYAIFGFDNEFLTDSSNLELLP